MGENVINTDIELKKTHFHMNNVSNCTVILSSFLRCQFLFIFHVFMKITRREGRILIYKIQSPKTLVLVTAYTILLVM